MEFSENHHYPVSEVRRPPEIELVNGFFHQPESSDGPSTDARRAYRMIVDLGYRNGPLKAVVIGCWSQHSFLGPTFTPTQAFLTTKRDQASELPPLEVTSNGSLLGTLGQLIGKFTEAPAIKPIGRQQSDAT